MTPSEPPPTGSGRIARVWALPLVLGSLLALGWFLIVNRTDGSAIEPEPRPSRVDGNRAYGYLKAICALGPRKSGSPANTQQLQMVTDHFRKNGATISEQRFQGVDVESGRPVEMVNLIGSWFPKRTERVVIAAHYDTRPYPDEDLPQNQNKPFLGANDGASGVALLMEIANHLADSPTPWGVDLVLFDGEELVYPELDLDYRRRMFLGSNEFSRRYKAARKTSKTRYVAGFVLDMVGDKDLDIPVEPLSNRLAPKLVREVWGLADRMGVKQFRQQVGREVLDDHLPMNDARIPTIDIIDFDYPHWHTAQDLPEECSGQSLEAVGKVVTAWLNKPKPSKGKTDRE